MQQRYQINKQAAALRFKEQAKTSSQQLQFALPLPEVVALIQQGLMSLALTAFAKLAEAMMNIEVDAMVGPRNRIQGQRQACRWGTQLGCCVVGGQKIPLVRPRVRDVRQREVPLGSYEMLQHAALMEEAVWQKIMHGLTTRGYGEVIREIEQAYGIEKTTVSEHFIEASRRRIDTLTGRALHSYQLCAMVIDGTYFAKQDLIAAIGITLQGQKIVLGLRQGASENTTVVKQLLEDLQSRGVDFDVPRLYILDGCKALHAAVRKLAGKAGLIQRCQEHKIRNVTDHLPESYRTDISSKMRNAYAMHGHSEAGKALRQLLHELMHLNPSAARSLEEGMEETIAVHRLRVPSKLRTSLATTNIIESAFSLVETVCRNVKRWRGGDQQMRWVASGLLWAESRWNRLHGYRAMPILVKELELAVVRDLPARHVSVA